MSHIFSSSVSHAVIAAFMWSFHSLGVGIIFPLLLVKVVRSSLGSFLLQFLTVVLHFTLIVHRFGGHGFWRLILKVSRICILRYLDR